MKHIQSEPVAGATGGTRARIARETLLLAGGCLFSLAVAMYGLASLKTVQAAPGQPLAVAPAAPALRVANANVALSAAGVADVVAKAQAFKATLSASQIATLEPAFTATLAHRWSNLPNQLCGGCRNGLQFSTLSSAQLAAALEVIKAARGTAANEGADEFNQIRLADTYLNANGGGAAYGEGNYFIAFLNAPSTTGAWLLQFGGHHYAANVAFNQGHVVGATPQHEALEPLSFTTNGATYAPLTQEHDALTAMLASLDATQLAAARLSTTFSDCVMIPGESLGGPSSFPATKVGLAVSGLSSAQKLLVLAAMKPWVLDADDTVAANLLSIYQSELDGTFIAFTGAGTAGDASTFLNSNANYARIDGPSVWIEFACQGGIVFRNQIHYHTVWRDHARDYGKDLSLTTALDASSVAAVTATSAASFVAGSLAPESIGALFGGGLASGTVAATGATLPTSLGGVQLQITDALNVSRSAPLFFVSPAQINFQMPQGAAAGGATLTVLRDGSAVGQGTAAIASVAPGLFAANANGQGVAAAVVLRVKADGSQSFESLAQYNASTGRFDAVAIDLGASTDQVFLVAYGTGLRNRSALSGVTASIGGTSAQVTYAGAQGSLAGLDQLNIVIPRSLAGRGSVDVVLTVDGKAANTVTVSVK